MEIPEPIPAGLDNDDVQDLEVGSAYILAAHDGAKAASEIAGFYSTLIEAGMSKKRAYELTAEWLAARNTREED